VRERAHCALGRAQHRNAFLTKRRDELRRDRKLIAERRYDRGLAGGEDRREQRLHLVHG